MGNLSIIDNQEYIKQEDAQILDIKYVLRFKRRICKYCGINFDIEDKGLFYWCGCEK